MGQRGSIGRAQRVSTVGKRQVMVNDIGDMVDDGFQSPCLWLET